MTAVSLHEIGASLFRLADGGLHKDDHEAPSDQNLSLFHHSHYKDWTQCRRGTANDAGYWVELKILGGVVIFDRGESGLEASLAYNNFTTTKADESFSMDKCIFILFATRSSHFSPFKSRHSLTSGLDCGKRVIHHFR